jgi:hypothetical protein
MILRIIIKAPSKKNIVPMIANTTDDLVVDSFAASADTRKFTLAD